MRLFKSDLKSREPEYYKVEDGELIKFELKTETKSANDAIKELGFETTQIHTIFVVTDYYYCIGVKIFTKDPILVITRGRKGANMKTLHKELNKLDWGFEYSSDRVEEILSEGIETRTLTFEYLNSVLKLKKENDLLFLASEFQLFLTFKNGYLESFASSEMKLMQWKR